MAKQDVTRPKPLHWDEFKGKPALEALPKIHGSAVAASGRARDWYWQSIALKRWSSFSCRWLSYLLGVAGVAAPLLSAIVSPAEDRLYWTQTGVASLAIAGLVQLGDRVFGFSSGWLRYVMTVTAMERLLADFELEWAAYFLDRGGNITDLDVRPLFDMAKKLEQETERLQAEETAAWANEFNSGMAALGEMIKLQKDAAEKGAEAAQAAKEAKVLAAKPGAIQVAIKQSKPNRPVFISIDGGPAHEIVATSWVVSGLAPAVYKVRLAASNEPGAFQDEKAAVVGPGAVATLELELP